MSRYHLFITIPIFSTLLLLTGCASTGQSSDMVTYDPLEPYNRAMFEFNDALDKVILKPAAKGYDIVVPEPISWGVSNFFSNLNDISVILNDLLQGKFEQAYQDTHRFVLNTTVGVAGIFDVASLTDLNKHNEDFGQTLGSWGVEPGAYVVLPFFGPRTVRDTVGLVGDYYSDPVTYVEGPGARNAFFATRVVDTRAYLLKAEKVLDEAAIDKYTYIRDAYLQRRQNLVYDGNVPLEEDFDIFEDE